MSTQENTNSENMGRVREIVIHWLSKHKISRRQLAEKVGINASVLSRFLNGETQNPSVETLLGIFDEIHLTFPLDIRYEYLKKSNLLPIVRAYGSVVSENVNFGDLVGVTNYELGMRFLLMGLEAGRGSWRQALPYFRKAENLFGRFSSDAPRAKSLIAQLFINFGDYEKAWSEIGEIEQRYPQVIDIETQGELIRMKAWIHYYQNNFDEARKLFVAQKEFAQKMGSTRLSIDAFHFLARIERDYGDTIENEALKRAHFANATLLHQKTYDIKASAGMPLSPMDRLREAQILRSRGEFDEAAKLLVWAKDGLSFNYGVAHILVEEARIALEDAELNEVFQLLDDALFMRSELNYGKGIVDALHVLALAKISEGDWHEAFGIVLAALCIYPTKSKKNDIWRLGYDCMDLLSSHLSGKKSYEHLIDRFYEQALSRTGYFKFLNHTLIDGLDQHIREVFSSFGLPQEGR